MKSQVSTFHSLGRRHATSLSNHLPTFPFSLIHYLLHISHPKYFHKHSLLFLIALATVTTLPYSNLSPTKFGNSNFQYLMANSNPPSEDTQDLNHPNLVPDDEMGSVKIIRSRQDVLEGSLDTRVLVGRIMALKPPNKSGVKNSIRKLWNDLGLTQITEVSGNNLMFTFKMASQAEQVLKDSPWFVLGCLLSVQEMIPGKPVTEVSYTTVPFLLQIHGLPLGFLNVDSIRAIMERVGTISEIEYPVVEGRVLRSFTRVRLTIDVLKPLWAGSWVTLEDDSKIWVVFKYENLQGLCFNCGLLGHDQRNCSKTRAMAPFNKSKPKFGIFLCVETPKALALLISEGMGNRQSPSPNLSPNPRPNPGRPSVPSHEKSIQGVAEVEVEDEGQGSNDTGRACSKKREGSHNKVSRKLSLGAGKEYSREEREEAFANIEEGVWLGQMEGMNHEVNLIDLTSDSEMELVQSLNARNESMQAHNWSMVDYNPPNVSALVARGKAPLVEFHAAQREGPSKHRDHQISSINQGAVGREYTISLPEEDLPRASQELMKQLDKATEQELIQSWNSRFHLKRGREDRNALEEIEDELIRRKKFKRESWYDEEGNALCVAISSEFGNQTYTLDEDGFPKPSSP